jgi:BTB/POZ domain-containing protein KCTD9
MKCFDEKLSELKMIYRGTEHEFTRKSWDDLCLNKGPTLSVIKADNGRIFGGYTSKSWNSGKNKADQWIHDDKAWIFSLDHQS